MHVESVVTTNDSGDPVLGENVKMREICNTKVHYDAIGLGPRQPAWTSWNRNRSPEDHQVVGGLLAESLRILGERDRKLLCHRYEARPERRVGEP